MMPVRKTDLPPTDKEEISRFNVSTALSNPHISVSAYKSLGYGAMVQVFLAFGIFTLVMGLGLLAVQEAGAGLVFLLVAALLLWLRKKIKSGWGLTSLHIGFDWKNNALWIKKESDKEAQMVINANCITSFTLSEHKQVRSMRSGFENPISKGPMNTNYTDKNWFLMAQMSNNTLKLIYVFDDKKSGNETLDKLQILLNQQN